jgi:hypothetical protein
MQQLGLLLGSDYLVKRAGTEVVIHAHRNDANQSVLSHLHPGPFGAIKL